MSDEPAEWPSGVGGVQCEDCERSTICRRVGVADGCGCEGWLCRPCAEGGWDDDELGLR